MVRGWKPVFRRVRLYLLLAVIFFTQTSFGQDTIRARWYVDAHPDEWLVRADITGFVAKPGDFFAVHSNIVKKSELTGVNKNLLVVQFEATASKQDKSQYIAGLKKQGLNRQLLALSKPAKSGSPLNDKIIFIDEQVLVAFKAEPTRAELESFSSKYQLELNHAPELNAAGNAGSVYVFKYARFTETENSATISAKIFEQEKDKIKLAQPNRVNPFEPHSTYDNDIDQAWHVANNGQPISCSSLSGAHHADAKISNAWNMGHTGQGIKVGVIDFYGFDYNHPDMQGQMLPGWDCINNASYNATNFYFTNASQAHGMAVCGVIAAKANNGIGSAGVAYDSKVIPFLIDGSEASVILAMQKARSSSFDVDVVNCSFGSYFPSPSIEIEIQNLNTLGRVRNGTAYGIVVVASHGNDHFNDVDHPQYPATYSGVISVSASTPDDRKKTPGDAWETTGSWGTNFGAKLDVAAPGVCIYTTDLSGSNGYSTGDYVAFQKTSASAPIVAGIAALILGKNPQTGWQDVKQRITDSADKTSNQAEGGQYNYQYNAGKPGHSMEMGYGRVNAEKALSDTPVGLEAQVADENKSRFIIPSFVNNMLDIQYYLNENHPAYQMAILDMNGKLLLHIALPAGSGYMNLDVATLTPGMYFVRCVSGRDVVANEKFIKVR